MRRETWAKAVFYAAAFAVILTAIGLAYMMVSDFAYYDNGKWVRTNMWTIYTQSRAGYGRDAIDDRRLGPNWGSNAGYAARNFTLNLSGLDYSLPLSWDDTVAGPGLWVVRPPEWFHWREVALYPTDINVPRGGKVTVDIRVAGEAGLTFTPEGAVFDRAYSVTLYRPWFSSVAYVVEISETEPSLVPVSVTDPAGAENVVREHLEATRDNNYEAWSSTLSEKRRQAYTEETKGFDGEFGVISLTVHEVRVSLVQTCVMRDLYSGSDLANSLGWSDEFVAENMVVVLAKYTVDYDHTKVPFTEGNISQYWYVVRDDQDSPWLVWEAGSPVVHRDLQEKRE
ncbi:MAG: DUF4829 domain-containing protein [Bacillota bacterium]|jgi:hypothetical protein